MSVFRILIDGEMQDETFSSEDEAEDYAGYLMSCAALGAEELHMSNPGDYPDEDCGDIDYEIIEEDSN